MTGIYLCVALLWCSCRHTSTLALNIHSITRHEHECQPILSEQKDVHLLTIQIKCLMTSVIYYYV